MYIYILEKYIKNKNIYFINYTYRTGSDIWGLGYVAWQTVPVSYRCTEVLWTDSVRPVLTAAFGAF